MKNIIYHGSDHIIENPIYGYGKKYNDYGVGFYCTESLDMAREWSVGIDRNGYANKYEIDYDNLNILNLNDEKYCILHWLNLLLTNRKFDVNSALAADAQKYISENFSISLNETDIIKGYRADDSYFSFAQDFINGTISYRQLNNAMKLGNLGEQIVLISKKSFNNISFVEAITADHNEWFSKKSVRDKKARNDYFNSERAIRKKGDIYITQILDEEMKADDLCLQ